MAGEPKREGGRMPKNPSLGDAVFVSVVAVMALLVCFWNGILLIVYGAGDPISEPFWAFILCFALSGYLTALAVMYTVGHIRTVKRRADKCDHLYRVIKETASSEASCRGTGIFVMRGVAYFVSPDEDSEIRFVVEGIHSHTAYLFTAEAFRELIETVSDAELCELVAQIASTRNECRESFFLEPPWRDKGD